MVMESWLLRAKVEKMEVGRRLLPHLYRDPSFLRCMEYPRWRRRRANRGDCKDANDPSLTHAWKVMRIAGIRSGVTLSMSASSRLRR